MRSTLVAGILAVGAGCVLNGMSVAAPPATHTDESRVPPYTLTDPLKFADGTPVQNVEDWNERRRPQILSMFATQVYGQAPQQFSPVKYALVSNVENALGGKAIRREYAITLVDAPQPVIMTMLVYLPQGIEKPPVFWGLNFRGNHSITAETDVPLNPNWIADKTPGVVNNKATEDARGSQASRWPVELILKHGYAMATAYYGDIDPDFDDAFQNGVHSGFRRAGQTQPAAEDWGSIAAWSWGLSRGLDVLELEPRVDGHRVIVHGHSRLGKAALWAGATDQRFALVISNDSGCGGAALSRRAFGESVARINFSFPHWFCGNFKRYDAHESALPVDQHELLALIAPRPLYVASATEDLWADPLGEYLSVVHASPVYRLLGAQGLEASSPVTELPPADQPSKVGTIGYHLRTGKHDITEFDWIQYLDFADRHLKSKNSLQPNSPSP